MPKVALLLLLLGPGLCVLGLACLRRDPASWWAAAFLAVSARARRCSSDVPVLSVFGSYAWGNGLLFVAALVAFWALGRMLGSRLASCSWSCCSSARSSTRGGRGCRCRSIWRIRLSAVSGACAGADGQPGPARSAVCRRDVAGGGARPAVGSVPWLTALAVLAGAVQLSGSRIALVAGIGAVVFAASRAGLRRGCLIGGAVALGIVLSMLVPAARWFVDATGDRRDVAGSRASGGALGERGARSDGPAADRLRAGSLLRCRDAAHVADDRALHRRRHLYADAHNFVVEVRNDDRSARASRARRVFDCGGRRARGPLVGFTIVVAITMLLATAVRGSDSARPARARCERSAPSPLPASGVGAERPVDRGTGRMGAGRVILVVLCGATALVGGVVGYRAIAGDAAFEQSVTERSPAQVDRADRLFPAWPDVPAQRASILRPAGS